MHTLTIANINVVEGICGKHAPQRADNLVAAHRLGQTPLKVLKTTERILVKQEFYSYNTRARNLFVFCFLFFVFLFVFFASLIGFLFFCFLFDCLFALPFLFFFPCSCLKGQRV